MKVAIPVWQDRVSPVFDVAGRLLLVDVADRHEIDRNVQTLVETMPHVRIRQIVEMGVNTLICAGISQPLEAGLADRGIRVIARVCGNVEDVLAAFLTGRLEEERFAMPGCCGQQRWRMAGQGCARRRRRGRRENP